MWAPLSIRLRSSAGGVSESRPGDRTLSSGPSSCLHRGQLPEILRSADEADAAAAGGAGPGLRARGVVGALHTPIEVSRARGFSRFVGRTDETATLEAALAR